MYTVYVCKYVQYICIDGVAEYHVYQGGKLKKKFCCSVDQTHLEIYIYVFPQNDEEAKIYMPKMGS